MIKKLLRALTVGGGVESTLFSRPEWWISTKIWTELWNLGQLSQSGIKQLIGQNFEILIISSKFLEF